MARDSELDTGFLQKQAKENARPGTSRGILMVLGVLLIGGIGFGVFKAIEFFMGLENLQHVRKVSVLLREPRVESNQAIVNVTLENVNAYPVLNPEIKFDIASKEGKELLKGKIKLDGSVPTGDQRTFHKVSLGTIDGKPAKLHSDLVKVDVNPPKTLPKGFNVKFSAACNAEDPVSALNELKSKAPDYAPLAVALGLRYEKLNKWDEAKKQYDEAIKLDPNLANAHYHLAQVLLRNKKTKEGMASLKKAAELAPADPDIKDFTESLTQPAEPDQAE